MEEVFFDLSKNDGDRLKITKHDDGKFSIHNTTVGFSLVLSHNQATDITQKLLLSLNLVCQSAKFPYLIVAKWVKKKGGGWENLNMNLLKQNTKKEGSNFSLCM